MKKFTQIGLFCLVILALFIFNKIYFNKDIDKISQPIIEDEQTVQPSGSSIIKNLKYEVT